MTMDLKTYCIQYFIEHNAQENELLTQKRITNLSYGLWSYKSKERKKKKGWIKKMVYIWM